MQRCGCKECLSAGASKHSRPAAPGGNLAGPTGNGIKKLKEPGHVPATTIRKIKTDTVQHVYTVTPAGTYAGPCPACGRVAAGASASIPLFLYPNWWKVPQGVGREAAEAPPRVAVPPLNRNCSMAHPGHLPNSRGRNATAKGGHTPATQEWTSVAPFFRAPWVPGRRPFAYLLEWRTMSLVRSRTVSWVLRPSRISSSRMPIDSLPTS